MTGADLPWFDTTAEKKLFARRELACVYAIGPESGRPLRIGYTKQPVERLMEVRQSHWKPVQIHEIVWTAGLPLALRLKQEIHRILLRANRHLNGDWFDITVDFALPVFQVATQNTGIQTFTHQAMIDDIKRQREDQIRTQVKRAGLLA